MLVIGVALVSSGHFMEEFYRTRDRGDLFSALTCWVLIVVLAVIA